VNQYPNKPPHLIVTIVLYIVGIMLVMMAVLILLKGLGVLRNVPDYVIWALVLLALGGGILGGLRSANKRY
jgi:divalent metal cation (Fe/Co/Zn/Cd) transporter